MEQIAQILQEVEEKLSLMSVAATHYLWRSMYGSKQTILRMKTVALTQKKFKKIEPRDEEGKMRSG